MFEKFTGQSRKAMALASQEALRHRQTYVGTEHLLLGIVKEGTGVAAGVLRQFQRLSASVTTTSPRITCSLVSSAIKTASLHSC